MDAVMQVVVLGLVAWNIGAGLEKIANALARDKIYNFRIVIKREDKDDGPQ